MHLKGICTSLTADSTKCTCIHTLLTLMLVMESHATRKRRWCKRSPVQSEIPAHPLGIKRVTARVASCLALLLHPVPVGCAFWLGLQPCRSVRDSGPDSGAESEAGCSPPFSTPFSRICLIVRSQRRVLENYLTRLPRAQERGTLASEPDAPLWLG